MHFSSFLIICSLGIRAKENTQTYQIRSKIDLHNDSGSYYRRSSMEKEVENEIEHLFCEDERLKVEAAQKCKLKDTG